MNYKYSKTKTEEDRLEEIARIIEEKIQSGEIKAYKYEDFAYIINQRNNHDKNCVCEEEEKYNYSDENEGKYYDVEKDEGNIHNPHDKLIKTILSDEREVTQIINKYLNVKIEEAQLEKYTSSFITKEYKARECDIVYKHKNKKIFFLIEHQSKIDRTMPYRMYEYSLEIMREAIKKNDEKKTDYLYPRVIPIVIYTGKVKWKINTNLDEIQEKLDGYEQKLGQYKVIDINDYTDDELLNDETMISKIMLIEKELKTDKILKILDKIIEKAKKDNQKEELYRILEYVLYNEITKEERERLIRKIESGGGGKMTGSEILCREFGIQYNNGMKIGMEEGRKEGRKEGIIEAKIQIIKEMLKEKMSIEEISRITKISKKEIEKLVI